MRLVMKAKLFTLMSAIIFASIANLGLGTDAAEKIRVREITWDNETQEFVIDMSVRYGVAVGGDKAGLGINVMLELTDFNGVRIDTTGASFEFDNAKPSKVSGPSPPAMGVYINLDPLRILWDRNGGTFSGLVNVNAALTLQNKAGKVSPKDTRVSFEQTNVQIDPVDPRDDG